MSVVTPAQEQPIIDARIAEFVCAAFILKPATSATMFSANPVCPSIERSTLNLYRRTVHAEDEELPEFDNAGTSRCPQPALVP
jgi:hypothetical protein